MEPPAWHPPSKSVIPAKIVKFPILDKRNAVRYLNGIFVHLLKNVCFIFPQSIAAVRRFPPFQLSSPTLSPYSVIMIPPSPAYTVATPAVFVITTSRKFARLHMISFTCSARSGLLQCAITRRLLAVSPPSLHAVERPGHAARLIKLDDRTAVRAHNRLDIQRRRDKSRQTGQTAIFL